MSTSGGGTTRGRGRGRGSGRGRGGGRITVGTTPTPTITPTIDPTSGSETGPPPPPASSPVPPHTSAEQTQPDPTSTENTSEASRVVTNAEGRIRLRLDGKKGFLPSNASTQEMTDVVKLMYDTPWLSYGKIPIEVKDRWFDKWMESFYFDQGVEPNLVRKTFDYRMGRVLQQMLRKVRLGNEEGTGWMTPTFKREVQHKFATDEGFQRRSATNKINRASAKGGSLHCGGSATIPSTQERMAKELNREPTFPEVFKQTHKRKRNKEEWVDERSEQLNELFITEFSARTQASQQSANEGNGSNSPIVVDPNEVWREVAGEPKKNHIYGMGSYFSRTLRTDPLLRPSRGTSEPPMSQQTMDELRTHIHGLTQELQQRVQQSDEAEERFQQLLTQAEIKMNATVEQARQELLREREECRKMREEMAAYYASVRATSSANVTAPAAPQDGEGGYEEEEDEDDADDYQDC